MNKYAKLGPKGGILIIVERDQDPIIDNWIKLTDEQMSKIQSIKEGKQMPMWMFGKITTIKEVAEIHGRYPKWNEETKEWFIPPLTEAQQKAIVAKSVYDVAIAAFESMPAGKQALWEPVKQAVADAVMRSDFAKARNILETTPVIYEGAEIDKDMFLALFPES